MRLLISPASPYVRKVRVLLREAGRTADVEEITVATTAFATDPQVMAANPLGKIPALILDDESALYDSRVITRYLDAHFDAGLYPDEAIWEVLRLEATGDGILDCALAMAYEVRFRPADKQSTEWLDAQWAKIARALDLLDSEAGAQLDGALTMGQISVACALGYLDFRHGARGWRTGRPQLAAWAAKVFDRPSMRETAPTS